MPLSVGSCPQVLHVFAVCHGFSLVLEPQGRLGCVGGRLGVLVRNLGQ